MKFKQIAIGLTVIATVNSISPTIKVFADSVSNIDNKKGNISYLNDVNIDEKKAIVSKFNIEKNEKYNEYKEAFKVDSEKIQIKANKPDFKDTKLEYMIDEDKNTFWAPSTRDSEELKTEVEYIFDEVVTLDRIAYSARQNVGTDQCGYPHKFEIYGTSDENGEYELVASGSDDVSTKETIEMKFKATKFKKLKFKFVETTDRNKWPHVGEIAFFKPDMVLEDVENLFTDETKSKVNEKYSDLDVLNKLEKDIKNHPFYDEYKVSVEDAKSLVQSEAIVSTESKITPFDLYENEEYNKAFKMDNSNIKSVQNNAGCNSKKPISYATDGDLNTAWESNTVNSDTFTNEVEIVFDEKVVLDRVVYGARQNDSKGFAQEFEIYGSKTTNGDTYELVSTGKYDVVKGLIEAKFEPTEFKRMKFKFKEGKDDWATISEIAFYKEDAIKEKMSRLFTDNTLSIVSEEFNTIEKLEKLEKEIEQHPLYNVYKEQVEDAKILVQKEAIVATKSKITQFNSYENKEYSKVFKMDNSNIKSVQNNAGCNSKKPISYATDEDLNTAWESNTVNSDTFTNEVEIVFNEKVVLDRVVYGARQNDSKGFAQEFEIYGSKTTNGDTYELVSTGKYNVIKGLIEAKFEPTEFKRMKFKFKKSKDNWATISEIAFYKEDKVRDEVNSVFEDLLLTKLSEKYDTIEEITALEKSVETHPLKDEFMEIINMAKEILNGSDIVKSEIITLSQRGDENKQKSERRRVYAGGNLDLTGYYIMPGEAVEVYVDADCENTLPQLVLAQVGEIDNNNKGNYKYSLKPGKNIITAPEGTTKGYAIYFANRALPNQQEYAPKVRIQGLTLKKYPIYIHGKTDPNEYIEAVRNHKGANMTDISSERFLISAQNSEAKIAYIDNGYSPVNLVKEMEEMISIYDMIGGYDENDENPIHRPSKGLYYLKMTNGSGLFASNEYTHLGASAARSILTGQSVYGWGNLHEFGHQVENSDMRLLEVTNNIYSIMSQVISGKAIRNLTGTQSNLDRYFTFEGTKGFGGFGDSYELTFGLFERLLVLTQVTNYFGIESYAQANRLVRENPTRYRTGNYQAIISALSEATGYDLSEHFEYYNYPVDDATKEFTSQFKKLDKKIRYTTLDSYEMNKNNADIFTKETKAIIKDIKTEEDGFTLKIGTNDNHKSTTAYEIYRDGKFVGFSRGNTYKDVVDTTKSYDYEVIAYDYKVNESIKSDAVNSNIGFKPQIDTDINVVLKLNDEFNPLEYVSPKKYNGEAIDINKVEILENNVDTSKKGKYKVVYQVKDREQTVTSEVNFEVVSDMVYASDVEWESATSGWRSVNKDKAVGSNNKIKLNIDGELKEFKKGIGAAATAEIVYDLSDKDYDYFESYIGIDKSYESQSRTSVDFKILADGKEVYKSETMKYDTKADYVKIPLDGVKELRLIADNHDGDGYGDYTSWGDAKFITTNSKPKLNVEKDIVTEVGKPVEDVIGKFSATDIEDGDITSSVVISGYENIDFSKPGKYTIKYEITDSDNNFISKEKNVSIIDMRDYKYLTDYDWKSATQSYGKTNKDLSVSGGTLRLTDENNEEVSYERGIGSHANATIIYDISGENYEYFTSYVGVDRAMYNRPGSVSFEVYVDGQKEFDSGLMNAKDPQKFVKVNVNKAKELKLVVKDGGNGNASDHATWGDTKLHFVNENRADITKLQDSIDKASKLVEEGKEIYTEESINNLKLVIDEANNLIKSDLVTQIDADNMINKLNKAVENLETIKPVVVNIEDEILRSKIKENLSLESDEITANDMKKLKSLDLEYESIKSLKGLEYAINLESLNINYSEISDISPIKDLKNLKEFTGLENFIMHDNTLSLKEDNYFEIEDIVIDLNGEKILPKEVVLSPRENPIKLNIEDILVGEKIRISSDLIQSLDSVEILYESEHNNFQVYTFYMLEK